jgi:hypothetical protein
MATVEIPVRVAVFVVMLVRQFRSPELIGLAPVTAYRAARLVAPAYGTPALDRSVRRIAADRILGSAMTGDIGQRGSAPRPQPHWVWGKQLKFVMDGTPNDRHNTAIPLNESGVAQCGERVEPPGVEEYDLMTEVAVDGEDILDRGQEGEVSGLPHEFFAHFAHFAPHDVTHRVRPLASSATSPDRSTTPFAPILNDVEDRDRARSTARAWWLYRNMSMGGRAERVELERGQSLRAREACQAYEFVAQTMDAGGGEAIQLVFELLEAASDDKGPVAVGAGPLEDLVNDHGDDLADALDQAARQSPKFAQALGSVAVEQGLRPGTADRLARWLPCP